MTPRDTEILRHATAVAEPRVRAARRHQARQAAAVMRAILAALFVRRPTRGRRTVSAESGASR